jgi:hypothetical protein
LGFWGFEGSGWFWGLRQLIFDFRVEVKCIQKSHKCNKNMGGVPQRLLKMLGVSSKNMIDITSLSYTREFLVDFKIYTSPLIDNS